MIHGNKGFLFNLHQLTIHFSPVVMSEGQTTRTAILYWNSASITAGITIFRVRDVVLHVGLLLYRFGTSLQAN